MDPIDTQVPENLPAIPDPSPVQAAPESTVQLEHAPPPPEPFETRILLKILLGPQGLRGGWSVALFALLFALFSAIAGFLLVTLHLVDPKAQHFTARGALFNELVPFLGMVGAAAIVALVERRRGNLLAFNLIGPRRWASLR
jgi:hypothetical protein